MNGKTLMTLLVDTFEETAKHIDGDPGYQGEEGIIKADEDLHDEGYYTEVFDQDGNSLG